MGYYTKALLMSRKEGGSGRRPLLSTFVGNNRQMLTEIRDSLSHVRKNGDGKLELPPQGKDLSQSTSNLVDKNAKVNAKGLSYTKRALDTIRQDIEPFKTVEQDPVGDGAGARPTTNISFDNDEFRKLFTQQLLLLGYDEVSRKVSLKVFLKEKKILKV